ncbi:MAG: hypothetical protein QM656_11480 [Paracoccaceae bacterium]
MSKSSITLVALCTVAFLAACAKKEQETVYVDQPTVTTEPTYTGKYK